MSTTCRIKLKYITEKPLSADTIVSIKKIFDGVDIKDDYIFIIVNYYENLFNDIVKISELATGGIIDISYEGDWWYEHIKYVSDNGKWIEIETYYNDECDAYCLKDAGITSFDLRGQRN